MHFTQTQLCVCTPLFSLHGVQSGVVSQDPRFLGGGIHTPHRAMRSIFIVLNRAPAYMVQHEEDKIARLVASAVPPEDRAVVRYKRLKYAMFHNGSRYVEEQVVGFD